MESLEQIENYKVVRDQGGTNYEAAATAFTTKEYCFINKIVFTDGELDGLFSHAQKTKVNGIYWIVFGNKMNFSPVSGKIIRVNENDLNKMINYTNEAKVRKLIRNMGRTNYGTNR